MKMKLLTIGCLILLLGGLFIYKSKLEILPMQEGRAMRFDLSETAAIEKVRKELKDPEYQKICGITGENLKFSTTTSYDNNHLDFVVKDGDSTNIFSVDKTSGNVDCNAVINTSDTE